MLSKALSAPFYAVIFVSRKSTDLEGYEEMDELVMKLATEQPGYLGYEASGDLKGGIFISYWESMEAIDNWRKHPIHIQAKAKATQWYTYYHTIISKVEYNRAYGNSSH